MYFNTLFRQENITNWDDFSKDGLRLERIIKILFTKLKKAKSDEKLVRLSNSIAFTTAKKMEVAKFHHRIEELEEFFRKQEEHKKMM